MKTLTARVRHVRREGDDIVTIYFTTEPRLTYTAGQYVTVFFADSSSPSGKAYSLSSAPHESWCSITVKNVGEYSGRLHALHVGDTFSISEAYGFFNPQTAKPLVCITAGCGLAPIWSVIKSELLRESSRVVHFFYSNKHATAIPFADDIAAIDLSHQQVAVYHHITQDETVIAPHRVGRINLDECAAVGGAGATYLLCGSIDFVRDMWRGLIERGIAPGAISTETFFE